MQDIQGLLFDLQGVLYLDGEPIPGAPETVSRFVESGIACRFLTNTTTRPRREIGERMAAMGFDIDLDCIFTPALAAVGTLRELGCKRLRLLAEPTLEEDFSGFEHVSDAPDAVVMGDLHTGFDWHCLNQAFDDVRSGAKLIALHRNRYCRRDGEIALDLGPFVAAIEYAAGVEATVVGKPDPAFFSLALRDLDCKANHTVMVGDDPFSDIDGAAGAGIHTVQVRTGKYAVGVSGETTPNEVIDSVADLPALLGI